MNRKRIALVLLCLALGCGGEPERSAPKEADNAPLVGPTREGKPYAPAPKEADNTRLPRHAKEGKPHKPTPEEVAKLFGFPKGFELKMEEKEAGKNTPCGAFLWEREYSNPTRSLHYVTIALGQGGSFLSSEVGKKLKNVLASLSNTTGTQSSADSEVQEATAFRGADKDSLLSFVTSATTDGRTVYSVPLAFSPSGMSIVYVLTSGDGKYDLFVGVFVDFERDTPEDKRLKNPVGPSRSPPDSPRDLMEELESLVYRAR